MTRKDWKLPPPGYTVADLIEEQGLTPLVVRTELKLSLAAFNRLLTGRHPITDVLARRLAATVGSTDDFWIERERQFRDSEAMGWPHPWAAKREETEMSETNDTFTVAVFACGPSREGCICKCGTEAPTCEHQWDGPTRSFDDGLGETASCSRCGMSAINHALWVGL